MPPFPSHHTIFLNFSICCPCSLLPMSNFSNGHTPHTRACRHFACTKSNQGGLGVSVDICGLGLIHIVLNKISFYVYCKLVFLFFFKFFFVCTLLITMGGGIYFEDTTSTISFDQFQVYHYVFIQFVSLSICCI